MAMHPNLQPNVFLKEAPFEEVQFFSNSDIYKRGVAFYNSQFANLTEGGMYFEKSATYFESPLAALRMSALVPKARIIVLLRDPLILMKGSAMLGKVIFLRN